MSFRESNTSFKLGELCEKIGSGVTPRGGDSVYKESGIALIRSQNVHDYRFTDQGLVYICREQALKMKNVEVEPNDVLLNITGDSVARCCIVPEKVIPARVNQHVAIIRTDEKILNAKYLLYWINNSCNKELLFSLSSTGATRKALTKGMIENLNISLPSIVEQNAIAATLSCLDDKIELNNRINKSLEEMAQALFKSWFVDFEPFQDGEFEDSDLGRIPKGWKVVKLSEMSTVQNGFAFKSVDYREKGCNMLRTTNISNDGFVNNTDLINLPKDFLTEKKYENFQFKSFDTVLVMVGASVGKIGIITEKNIPALQNQNMWRFRPILKSLSPIYIHYAVKIINEKVKNWTSGSARDFYRKDSFLNSKFILPPDGILEDFSRIAKPIFTVISNNLMENEKVENIRNILLPKLMTGEIRIPIEEVN